ncbi:MAG: extracellular solute-binding protein, partial [Clostridia bacterium]
NVLFYDKTYTEANGITVPTTVEGAWSWDEFVSAAKRLTVDLNGKHADEEGFDPQNIDVYGVADVNPEIMALSNGGGYFSPDGKELWLSKPETIEAIQKVADLMNVYHVAPIPTTREAIGGGNNPLMTKKVAMHINGQFCLLWYGDFIPTGEINLGVGVLPKMKNLVTTNSGPAITIFKNTKNPEICKDILSYFYNTENILGNIHKGLWMPSEQSWYEDEALKAKWVDESNIHPAEYKQGIIDMARDYTVPNAFYTLGNTNELYSIINPALDQVWLGERTAEDVVLNDIMPQIQPIFDEYWAERQ